MYCNTIFFLGKYMYIKFLFKLKFTYFWSKILVLKFCKSLKDIFQKIVLNIDISQKLSHKNAIKRCAQGKNDENYVKYWRFLHDFWQKSSRFWWFLKPKRTILNQNWLATLKSNKFVDQKYKKSWRGRNIFAILWSAWTKIQRENLLQVDVDFWMKRIDLF